MSAMQNEAVLVRELTSLCISFFIYYEILLDG